MKLDDVKKLHHKKYRSQFGYYLVEGEHLILELQNAAQKTSSLKNITLYVTEDYQQWVRGLELDCAIQTVSHKQMSQISDTKTPQGIIARVPMPTPNTSSDDKSTNTRCIYLHQVQDPGNLGTILRTLAWFGNFRLLLSANSVDPYNPKVVRSSMGAIFHVPIELDVELSDLHQRFEKFAYLDMHGTPIGDSDFKDFECYLFGNEARGVPREALTQFNAQAYTIKGSGTIESLNVATAVNICVYQLSD